MSAEEGTPALCGGLVPGEEVLDGDCAGHGGVPWQLFALQKDNPTIVR
jgi:hypothetical protein